MLLLANVLLTQHVCMGWLLTLAFTNSFSSQARIAGPAIGGSWLGSALLPATLAYTTVKGVGWYDWGYSGLNDLEVRLNSNPTK